MLAKTIIQNLEDSELIRIFLDFVQTFHLQYEKINKEISYKCHEATWILATTKATGYGRTQSEAYKHALRNLLEILIEDPPYVQFFTNIIQTSSSCSSKGGATSNSHSLTNSVNPFTGSSVSTNMNRSVKAAHHYHRTQSSEIDAYAPPDRSKQKERERLSMYSNQNNNNNNNNQSNGHSNSNSKLTGFNFSTNYCKHEEETSNNINNPKSKKQVYHTKISLNCPPKPQDSDSQEPSKKSKRIDEEIKKAKGRMHRLEQELSEINKQNKSLKERLNLVTDSGANPHAEKKSTHHTNSGSFKTALSHQNPSNNALRLSTGSIKSSNTTNQHPPQPHTKTQPSFPLDQDIENGMEQENPSVENPMKNDGRKAQNDKILVPKLKLEILPNYHKKSEKSLNESLLAVYNEKHGAKKMM